MAAVILGLVLIIAAVVAWVGHLSTVHAVAILLGAVGVLLVLYWAVPGRHWEHRA
jgi:hypothetical protein